MGQAEPTRIDLSTRTSPTSPMSARRPSATLEQYYQVDLSALVPDASTGEVVICPAHGAAWKPTTASSSSPPTAGGEDEIYIAKLCRSSRSAGCRPSWSENDLMVYGITGTAMVDSAPGSRSSTLAVPAGRSSSSPPGLSRPTR